MKTLLDIANPVVVDYETGSHFGLIIGIAVVVIIVATVLIVANVKKKNKDK